MLRGLCVVAIALAASCRTDGTAPAGAEGSVPDPRPEPTNTVLGRNEPAPGVSDARPPAAHPFQLPLPDPRNVKKATATRFAELSPPRCRAELKKRGISPRPAGLATPGVATPLRLPNLLRGIQFVTPNRRSKFGVLDCRLALALDELASLLSRHGISAVTVDNFYRPGARRSDGRMSQHAQGLAIDIMSLKLEDGRTLVVKNDWHGAIGTPVCGSSSGPTEPTPEALALWTMVCEVAREGLFHHMLTPNNDAAHADHLHFDIERGARSFLVR